jgi:hypothetical protein
VGELFLWMLAALLVLALVGAVLWGLGIAHDLFGDFGQGAAGLLSVIALFVAAGIYFFERGNKPKVVLQPPMGTVTPIEDSAPGNSGDAALLHLAMTIENRSSNALRVQCAALDIIAVDVSGARNSRYYEDLPGVSLLNPPAGKPLFDNCVTKFEAPRRERERESVDRQAREAGTINPMRVSDEARTGARFTDFSMEPGEVVTKTWDQRISCDVQAVQVIFKVPKPDEVVDYEAKNLIPIAAACRPRGAGDRG